jgi:glucose/arabinose dehydrogenase
VATLVAVAFLVVCTSASAKPPNGFELHTIVRGLDEPTGFVVAPDGRIYISQKKGIVRVFDHGKLLDFLNLRKQVSEYDERGLDSIALDPAFATNRKIYLLYTADLRPDDPDQLHPGSGTLVSVRVSKANPDVPERGSVRTILTGDTVLGPWHAAAGLAFDAKGHLLVGFGDGSPYYPKDYSKAALWTYDLSVLDGKVLRIDPATGHGVPGNPFFDPAHPNAVRSKVLAYGFRNPFSIHFDRATDRIYIGDVGTDQWEEVDVIPESSIKAGVQLNFGWPCYEGGDQKPVHQPAYALLSQCVTRFYEHETADTSPTVPPDFAYSGHGGAAIIVGPVYRGGAYPKEYDGTLFLADWVKDQLWTLKDGKASNFGSAGGFGNPVNLQVTPRGTIAYLAFSGKTLNEIVYVGGEGSGGTSVLIWFGAGAAGILALIAILSSAMRRSRRRA